MVAPAAELLPAAHCWHVVDAPTAEYVPALQAWQGVAPPEEYVPGWHYDKQSESSRNHVEIRDARQSLYVLVGLMHVGSPSNSFCKFFSITHLGCAGRAAATIPGSNA